MPLAHELIETKIFYQSKDIPTRQSKKHFVFIGRSNVGKSSLINKILKRKKAAFVSSKPGKTASINYFLCYDHTALIDLPGFGYAKQSKKTRNEWDELIDDFFSNAPSPMHVFLLIDSRHGVTKIDQECIQFLLDKHFEFSIILTKVDKLKKNEQRELMKELVSEAQNETLEFIPFSILKPQLIEDLYDRIFT